MDNTFTDFRLGWEEWVALHDLGLPALEAKIDTGAKTSALHAKDIEPFGSASKPQVRFTVQPIPNSPRVSIPCAAPIIDHRDVTSSNGQTERRCAAAKSDTTADAARAAACTTRLQLTQRA